MKPETECYRVLSPTAILGYGFPQSSFERGMSMCPDVIAVDAGSIDPGPYYLGAGKSFTSYEAVKRDLGLLLKSSMEHKIPLLIGTAGGAGARPHVDWTRNIIKEISKEQNYSFPLATIYADIPKETLLKAQVKGKISPLAGAGTLSEEDIRKSVRIVAQMGVEPVINALDLGAHVVLCGRCYDPVPFAAQAIMQGMNSGLAYHMGKILECAAIAATPGSGSDCVIGTLYRDHFELEALNEERRFTCTSTAAHSLYEKSDPYTLSGPGGYLDLRKVEFSESDNRRILVSGAKFVDVFPYQIKLEGVRSAGYRTICIAGARDPNFIGQIDAIMSAVKTEVLEYLQHDVTLHFRIYGKNAVMGESEPKKDIPAHEVGIVIETIADTQSLSEAACSYVRSKLLHYGYPERVSTAGNLAIPFSPSDLPCGMTYEFTAYHLLEVADPCEFFKPHLEDL